MARASGLIALAFTGSAILSFRWISEADLGWHLAQGREVANGHLVRTNLFSAGYPTYPQQYVSWLFELGAYGLWKIGGDTGIQTGQLVAIALTLALLYLACRARATVATSVAILAFGLFVIEPRAVPRPHLVSLTMMAACAMLIERARRSRSAAPIAWAIPLIAVWSNVHVECLFGAAFIGMFAIGEFIRPSALSQRQARAAIAIAAGSAVASIANPYGLGIIRYLYENSQAPEFVAIAEFRPAYLPVYAPFFAYLTIGAGLLMRKPRELTLWEGLVFAAFSALALRHVRFVALFFCATAPMVAARLTEVMGNLANSPGLVATALFAGLVIAPTSLSDRVAQFGVGSNVLEPPAMFSPYAISFIRSAGLTGDIFNSNNLGGYLIWNLYPEVRVFQDGRFQSYPREHFVHIIEAYRSQSEWDRMVASVDWAVLSMRRSSSLSGAGRFPSTDWAPVYWDDAVEIVIRRLGRFGALAASHEYRFLLPSGVPALDRLDVNDRETLLAEARRNERENPIGFQAPALLCANGEAAACDRALAAAFGRPELRVAAVRLRTIRDKTAQAGGPFVAPGAIGVHR